MTSPVRILIVEDEFITLDLLRDALTDLGYQVVAAVMKAADAVEKLKEGNIDLAILDVHLGKGPDGIWIGEQIQQQFHIPFIFLTAFGDKATIAKAAKTQPASYLVKPFVKSDLYAAIELALHSFADAGIVPPPADIPEAKGGLLINDSIFVKDKLVYCRVPVREIGYIQAYGNYVEVVVDNKEYLLRTALNEFIERLPSGHFFQVHRSYVINLEKITAIGGNFVTVGDREVPLSRSSKPQLLERLELFS